MEGFVSLVPAMTTFGCVAQVQPNILVIGSHLSEQVHDPSRLGLKQYKKQISTHDSRRGHASCPSEQPQPQANACLNFQKASFSGVAGKRPRASREPCPSPRTFQPWNFPPRPALLLFPPPTPRKDLGFRHGHQSRGQNRADKMMARKLLLDLAYAWQLINTPVARKRRLGQRNSLSRIFRDSVLRYFGAVTVIRPCHLHLSGLLRPGPCMQLSPVFRGSFCNTCSRIA